jgi:hypothetical protein
MNPILRNIIAIVTGIIVGSVVNMGIITMSSSVIPPPVGVDVNNMDALKASMHLFEPKHFLFPFMAHALGTFAGALMAAVIAANSKMQIALGIGVFFLIGGISAIFMLPSPLWFSIIDLVGAYLPMGFLGAKLAMRIS